MNDEESNLRNDVARGVLVFKKMFCPVHRRYTDFVMEPSDDPNNPNLFCPKDRFRISYLDASGGGGY